MERYRLAYETDARKSDRHVADMDYPCPSLPQVLGGNPESSCKKPLVLASAGSTSQLLNNPLLTDVLYFYHVDHLGTPMLMTDENQTVVWEGEFLPFGEEYLITGTVTNNLRFPGQHYDEETGLHQNWYRDYRPQMGTYIEVGQLIHYVESCSRLSTIITDQSLRKSVSESCSSREIRRADSTHQDIIAYVSPHFFLIAQRDSVSG